MIGCHLLKAWSSTQGVIALSSAEAEYYAMLKGASLAGGLQAMADDLGMFMGINLHTDSSAAKGIVARKGLGKTRHISVVYLWLQDKAAKDEIRVKKIPGAENPSDLMTKYLSEAVMEKHRQRMLCEDRDGRHPLTPGLNREG